MLKPALSTPPKQMFLVKAGNRTVLWKESFQFSLIYPCLYRAVVKITICVPQVNCFSDKSNVILYVCNIPNIRNGVRHSLIVQ